MAAWWAINIDRDNEKLYDAFYEKAAIVENVCDEILDKNENDANALFYKGGAVGYRGMIHSLNDSWMQAAQDGKTALNLLDKANELDPNNVDVKFGLGIYNFFAEYVPEKYPIVKPLMIIFPKGDKIKGLVQIKDISNNSKYAKTEAKFILAYLYSYYEKNYYEAQFYAQSLVVAFPENPLFRQLLNRSFIGMSSWQQAIDGWGKVLEMCDSNRFGFTDKVRREANYYIGVSYLVLRKLNESEKYLLKAEEMSPRVDKEQTEIYLDALLKLGMTYDLLGNRNKSDEYYNRVINSNASSPLKEQAERWKRERYR